MKILSAALIFLTIFGLFLLMDWWWEYCYKRDLSTVWVLGLPVAIIGSLATLFVG